MPKPHRQTSSSFAAFLAARGAPIAQSFAESADRARRWRGGGRSPRSPARPALGEFLPRLLSRIVELADALEAGTAVSVAWNDADRREFDEISKRFDLHQVIEEYAILRDCVLEHWEAARPDPSIRGVRVLNRVIDAALTAAVDSYSRQRARLLEAVDKVGLLALESPDLDALLRGFLDVLVGSSVPIDNAVIMLREGDVLRVRASVGLNETLGAVKVGEGFAGHIAETGETLSISYAANDPWIESELVKMEGVQTVLGAPLADARGIVGVLKIGSVSADSFSEDDRNLLQALASRATIAIRQSTMHEHERELRRHAELAGVIAENATAALFMTDASGRCTFANPAAERLTGYSRDELVGKALHDVVHHGISRGQPHVCVVPSTGDRAMAREERDVFVRKDGSVVRVVCSASPVVQDGELAGALLEARDVTEEQRAMEERELFLAALGHDLRTPLGAIRLSAEVLLHRGLPPTQTRAASRIVRTTDRMVRMIDDLLDFARTQRGALPIYRAPTDLQQICEDVIAEAELNYAGRAIQLVKSGSAVGDWDRDRLTQVVQNLVTNALQYGTEEAPIVVRVSANECCELVVENRGRPIPPDLLPALFEPMKRGRRGGKGLGLGLYIAQQIVHAHGGIIVAESSGDRTRFVVKLPIV